MVSIDRRIVSFLAIAYGITWAIAGIAYLLGITSSADPIFVFIAALSMFGPGVAALIQQRLIDRAPWAGLGLPIKGTRWGVLAATAFIGLSIVPLCLMVLHLFGDIAGIQAFGKVSITSERLVIALSEIGERTGSDASAQAHLIAQVPAGLVLAAMLFAALLASFTINLPFMLGEELGWRGYLFQRTVEWKGIHRILFTGIVWGLWHAPLVAMGHNYPGQGAIGIMMMVGFTTIVAFLFDWTRSRSRSVWSSCVLHGLINGSTGAMAMFAWGGHVLVGSVVGIGGFITLVILSIGIVVLDPQYRAILSGQGDQGPITARVSPGPHTPPPDPA